MNNSYVGGRYIPKHCGIWDSLNKPFYESLSVVYYGGKSYTSKKDVPVGIEITDNNFWAESADYNEQMELYKTETDNNISNLNNSKVNVDDITDNLTSSDSKRVLSSNQGRILNEQITENKEQLADNTSTLTSVSNNQGSIGQLKTTDKSNIVNAINELKIQSDTNQTEINTKASQSYVDEKIGNMGNALTFKGADTTVNINAKTGAAVNDYWYSTDDNTNIAWNGTAWIPIGNNLNIGENAIKLNTLNDEIKTKLAEFKKLSYDVILGAVFIDGSINSSSSLKYIKVACIPKDKLRTTVTVNGLSTAMAVFFKADGSFLSYLNQGTNGTNTQYTDYEFEVPVNAYFVATTGLKDNEIKIEKYTPVDAISLKNAISNYNKMDYELNYGAYYIDGSLNSSVVLKCLKVACNPKDKLRTTVTVNGLSTAMAVFFKADGSFLSFLNEGANGTNTQYTNYEFEAPDNAYFVAITGLAVNEITLEQYGISQVAKDNEDINKRLSVIEDLSTVNNSYWKGKKIAWFGTSIPCGFGNNNYPYLIGNMTGATIFNEAVGSSCARAGEHSIISAGDTLGWTGCAWENIAYSLSQTIAEKNELINNWDTWKTKLTGNPPDTLDDTEKTKILNCSYENKLVSKYLGSDDKRCDLYVFDHGHNDSLLWDNTKDELPIIPTDTTDRTYFIGAMNFLIKLILTDNPKAKICFISHYENKIQVKQYIVQAQEILSDFWDFPICKLYKKLGWTQQTVITTGYWNNGVWIENGGTPQTLTLTQIWLADNLHPHSDTSGKANLKIAENITSWLNNVR